MITLNDVSAILPTRGDVDLEPILATIPFTDIVVWDNSKEPTDSKTYGRHLAEARCKHDIIYHQDDDIIFRNYDQLLAAYEPGMITASMPSPWYEDLSYDKIGQVMLGAGSLVDRGLVTKAVAEYLAVWPYDDDFLVYCDCIVGALVPSKRIDGGYEILPQASAPNRIYTQPGAHDRKMMMNERAFAIRAARPQPLPASYVAELDERLARVNRDLGRARA